MLAGNPKLNQHQSQGIQTNTYHMKQNNSGNMVIVQRQWQRCWTNRPDPADLFQSYCMVPDTTSLTQHSLWLHYYGIVLVVEVAVAAVEWWFIHIFPCFPFAHHLPFSGFLNSFSLSKLWVRECGTHTYLHTHSGTSDNWSRRICLKSCYCMCTVLFFSYSCCPVLVLIICLAIKEKSKFTFQSSMYQQG